MDITEDQFGDLNLIIANSIKSPLLKPPDDDECATQIKNNNSDNNNHSDIPTLHTCSHHDQLLNTNHLLTTCDIPSNHQQSASESKEVKESLHHTDKDEIRRVRRPTIYRLDDANSITTTDNPAENYKRLSLASLASSQELTKVKKFRLLEKMAALVKDSTMVSVNELPMTFQVKYLGHCPAKGLWGIKNTRGPVDAMVKSAKNLAPGEILPLVKVQISTKGITLTQQNSKGIKTENMFSIETISYGVQDLIYTRVFSMIIVYEDDTKSNVMSQKQLEKQHPFECHAFVCESRNAARKLTYALAAAFQDYSKQVQQQSGPSSPVKKKFAIDLRSPDEIQDDMDDETEA